jgi:hypothetical protein
MSIIKFSDQNIHNTVRMGFTFLMDANTSKYLYNFFNGSEANSYNSLINEKISGIERLVLLFPNT